MQYHDASDDAADEPGYPLAPLPVHERTWRHPSEVGKASWEATEPPVTIGRGLLVTTTAIGFVLGLAVLFLLAPMGDQGFSSGRSASPSTAADGVAAVSNTVLVHHRADEPLPSDATPVAVAVGPTGMIVTTVGAIVGAIAESIDVGSIDLGSIDLGSIDLSSIDLSGIDLDSIDTVSIIGTSHDALGTVVSTAGALAFILPSSTVDVIEFDQVDTAEPGQVLTVLAERPTEIVFGRQSTTDLTEAGVREGTPVVDASGALVALCTLRSQAGATRIEFVPVAPSTPGRSEATTSSADATD